MYILKKMPVGHIVDFLYKNGQIYFKTSIRHEPSKYKTFLNLHFYSGEHVDSRGVWKTYSQIEDLELNNFELVTNLNVHIHNKIDNYEHIQLLLLMVNVQDLYLNIFDDCCNIELFNILPKKIRSLSVSCANLPYIFNVMESYKNLVDLVLSDSLLNADDVRIDKLFDTNNQDVYLNLKTLKVYNITKIPNLNKIHGIECLILEPLYEISRWMCRDQYTTTLSLLLKLIEDSSIFNSIVKLKISTEIMDEFFHINDDDVHSFVNAIEYYKNYSLESLRETYDYYEKNGSNNHFIPSYQAFATYLIYRCLFIENFNIQIFDHIRKNTYINPLMYHMRNIHPRIISTISYTLMTSYTDGYMSDDSYDSAM
jgi:hypothetical protein